jgi:hypothetical protein
MILITDISFFEGALEIANINETGGPAAQVNDYIRQHEPKLLTDVLGYELYGALQASLFSGLPDDNFQRLMFGDTYTLHTHLHRWNGLIDTSIDPYAFGSINTGYKRSFIANYIYWHWQRDHATFSTGTGEKTIAPTGTVAVSPATKMRSAWNEMSGWIQELWTYLRLNTVLFPDWHVSYRTELDYKKINPYL